MKHVGDRSTCGAPLLLWLLLCLALLFGVTSHSEAQTENSPTSSTNWKARYYALLPKVAKLETAWEVYKETLESAQQKSATLSSDLAALLNEKQSLLNELNELNELAENWQTRFRGSQAEVARLIPLSESLQTRLDAISARIQEVEQTAQAAIVRAAAVWGFIGFVLGMIVKMLL